MREESEMIEAMKQALEALELTQDGSEFAACLPEEWSFAADKDYDTMRQAIVALRAAIAEASMQRLTDVQQEMEQEPMAPAEFCRINADGTTTYHWEIIEAAAQKWQPGCDDLAVCLSKLLLPLRPNREWVGLTDEEVEDLYFDGFSMSQLNDFSRAIEAKLKEKNSG